MKKIRFILLILVVSVQFSAAQAFSKNNQDNGEYTWGIEYSQRFLFFDNEKWNSLIPQGSNLPELGPTVRFHGFRFYVESNNWLCFGFSAYGALSEKRNENGYTNWEGAMAGFFFDVRRKLIFDLYGNIGFASGCGRFNFLSMDNSGTGISGYSNAFRFDPFIGISYYIMNQYILKSTISTFFDAWRAKDWVGTDQEKWVLPRGFMLSFTIGSRFH